MGFVQENLQVEPEACEVANFEAAKPQRLHEEAEAVVDFPEHDLSKRCVLYSPFVANARIGSKTTFRNPGSFSPKSNSLEQLAQSRRKILSSPKPSKMGM